MQNARREQGMSTLLLSREDWYISGEKEDVIKWGGAYEKRKRRELGMNVLWYPREHLSETPKKKKLRKRSCTLHVIQRNEGAWPGVWCPLAAPRPPHHNTHTHTHTHTHTQTCIHMHTLLDNHSGLPLACTEPSCGHLCVPPVDILRSMGTWLSKQTVPLCEGKGTSSSTWTQASARAPALASVA